MEAQNQNAAGARFHPERQKSPSREKWKPSFIIAQIFLPGNGFGRFGMFAYLVT